MDGSLSQFMATLQRRKARKEKNSEKFEKKSIGYNYDNNRPVYNFPDLTNEELIDVKENIKTKLKSQNRTNTIISSIAFFILVVVIYVLIT